MIRVLNFACFAITALVCLALYHISEQTRVARVQLSRTVEQIRDQHAAIKVLEADWERVSSPARIQVLASTRLGLSDTATAELASLELLPARGEVGPLVSTSFKAAGAAAPAQSSEAPVHLIVARSGD